MPIDIIPPRKLLQLRKRLAPGKKGDLVQIWRRNGAMVDGQTMGGGGTDERGYPVTASAIVDEDPDNDLAGFTLYKTVRARVESASKGRENEFGAQNTSVAPWDIVCPAIDLTPQIVVDPDSGVETKVYEELYTRPGDLLIHVKDDGTRQSYEAVSDDSDETYLVLLTVNCQRIER